MKITRLILCFIISATFVCCSGKKTEKPAAIQIQQDFKVGETYHYEIQIGKVDSRRPESVDMLSSTDVELRILGMQDSLKLCSWKYGSSRIIGMDEQLMDEKTKQIMGFSKGLEIKFTIDKNGTVIDFTNYEECRQHIEKAFRLVYDLDTDPEAAEKMKDFMEGMKSTYENAQVLVAVYCPDMTIFFGKFGTTIKTDSADISDSSLPNPFGGDDIPTVMTTTVDSIGENIAFISTKQTVSPEELRTLVDQATEAFGMPPEAGLPGNVPKMKIDMSTTATYQFDFLANELREAYAEKLTTIDNVKQKQSYRVILRK